MQYIYRFCQYTKTCYSYVTKNMSEIVGYIGYKPAAPILIDGLRSVEYRGYDSVGMYLTDSGPHKTVGSVQTLVEMLPTELSSTAGIAHTRWATHGVPSQRNTHPHSDHTGTVWVVHNGMIENYTELKDELMGLGYTFYSETDTEILAHLIGIEYKAGNSPQDAVANALSRIVGTYGIAVMFKDLPDTIIIANMGESMSIGIKEGEYIIASDTAPMLRHTSNVVPLKDGEYAVIKPDGYSIYSFDHKRMARTPKTLNAALEMAKSIDHPQRMLKDILEIPTVLENSVRGRILMGEGNTRFGKLEDYAKELRHITHLIIVGCGTSYFAGSVGKLFFEDHAGLSVEVQYGSEFSNRKFIVSDKKTAVLVISQSGETPDIIASVDTAKRAGLLTLGMVNVIGSTVSRMVDVEIYNHAGPDIGVRPTKTFISQLEVLALLSIYFGRLKGVMSRATGAEISMEIRQLPEKVRTILSRREKIKRVAEEYLGYDDFLFVGREYNTPTAYEGALKLKRASYVHAEAFPSGEVKHGPITMLNDIFPIIAIMPSDSMYQKMVSDIKELRSRKCPILAVATTGNADIKKHVDDVIYIPDTRECLTPILASIPLQLFAYYTGVLRGFSAEEPPRPSNIIF